jgi:hypothetical protein
MAEYRHGACGRFEALSSLGGRGFLFTLLLSWFQRPENYMDDHEQPPHQGRRTNLYVIP